MVEVQILQIEEQVRVSHLEDPVSLLWVCHECLEGLQVPPPFLRAILPFEQLGCPGHPRLVGWRSRVRGLGG